MKNNKPNFILTFGPKLSKEEDEKILADFFSFIFEASLKKEETQGDTRTHEKSNV